MEYSVTILLWVKTIFHKSSEIPVSRLLDFVLNNQINAKKHRISCFILKFRLEPAYLKTIQGLKYAYNVLYY